MTVETAPRQHVTRQQASNETPGIPGRDTRINPPHRPSTSGPAETQIRIHKDGLLIAKCHARGLAPGRLFAAIDPLHYPVNSHLSLEFVMTRARGAKPALLTATVTARSIHGIELQLDPTPA